MKASLIIIGLLLIVGAIFFQNYYNKSVMENPTEILTNMADSMQRAQNVTIIFWVAIAIGGICVFAGIQGK